MKIETVSHNNKRQAFEVTSEGRVLSFPYVKALPSVEGRVTVSKVWVDKEIASEGFSFLYGSGQEETVHIEQVLAYNNDPGYLRELLVYRLTVEAQRRIKGTRLGRREIIRRLRTSSAQLYRLLDQTNVQKTIDRLVELLAVLDCVVAVSVHEHGPVREELGSASADEPLAEDVVFDLAAFREEADDLGTELNKENRAPRQLVPVAAEGR